MRFRRSHGSSPASDAKRHPATDHVQFHTGGDIDIYGKPVPVLLNGVTQHLLVGKTDLRSKVFCLAAFYGPRCGGSSGVHASFG